ncbi:unnamed protein product [Prorocentrum cordatum]|uniref:Subtilisin n=2 Tax=Prorocentrum TaxID=2944 RepID=A0ABN9TPM7_9DINO|nr:unknown [Prorocentrum minimum]CAK0848066.1 unnamed protein product [Polarella glacialis]
MGEISTHVISKLGQPSVAGATVEVRYNASSTASVFDVGGWELVGSSTLSENGGNDTLVEVGSLQIGLYALTYDFSNIDAAARRIYRRLDDDTFSQLHPTGFFLGVKTTFVVKVENPCSANHLVVTVGEKEVTVRPGVRQH